MTIFKEIEKLQKEIKNLNKITIEQQIEFDSKIMELQFEKINSIFEDMRTELADKEIITISLSEEERKELIEKLKKDSIAEHKKQLKSSTIKYKPNEKEMYYIMLRIENGVY